MKLVHSYLQNRKQRMVLPVANGKKFSQEFHKDRSWVHSYLIKAIKDNYLTLEGNYFTSYADDTSPYVTGNNTEEVISEVKAVTQKLFTGFAQNEMKANLNKCHLLLSTTDTLNFEISETVIRNSNSKKLLGVTFDNKLKFEKHVIAICQRANRKLNALARLIPYMELGKIRILMNAFFNYWFNYCPVIWMYHSRALNNEINRLHEQCLRIIYNDKTSTFKELLEKDNSISIHYRNIQAHATEMHKVANGMSLEIMNEIFQLREKSHYNLRYTSEFIIPPIHSVYHGSKSASYSGPKLWELIPTVIRQIDTLSGFKIAIKEWKPINCPCRICKTYIPNVGFL